MSKLLPIIGGVTGTAIIGGTGAYLISTQKTRKIKEQFSHSLISSDDTGNLIFQERLKKLKGSGESNPNNLKLKNAKSKATADSVAVNAGLDELKQGCKEIYESNFTDRNSGIFKDFETYCSKNIKDAIAKDKWALTDSSFAWKDKQNPKLTSSKSPLVAELATIKNKSPMGDEDLKNWCTSVENTLFERPEDMTFKNASEFCKKD